MKYWIIGGDGREYGPEEASQIRVWIAEGRLDANSRVKVEGENLWRPLGDLAEFAGAPRPPEAAPAMAPASPGGGPGSRAEALRQVRWPALALGLNGAAAMLLAIVDFVVRVLVRSGRLRLEDWLPTPPPGMEQLVAQALQGIGDPFGMVLSLIAIVVNGLVIFGAMKMKRLQLHGLALTIGILSAIPCQCCCVVGLPVGIWALVVLSRPEVKSQFS
jgi:hypothetical protein